MSEKAPGFGTTIKKSILRSYSDTGHKLWDADILRCGPPNYIYMFKSNIYIYIYSIIFEPKTQGADPQTTSLTSELIREASIKSLRFEERPKDYLAFDTL